MSVFAVLSFNRLKKDTINDIVSKAEALGYELDRDEVTAKETDSGHWLIMPSVLHKWDLVFEDGYPVDKERATMPFVHVRSDLQIEHMRVGLFGTTKTPVIEPEAYEIAILEWSLVAVIDPDGSVSWGKDAFSGLLSQVFSAETSTRQISGSLKRQANRGLRLSRLTEHKEQREGE